MILTLGCRLFRSVIVIGGGFVLSGCYYMQAVRGQVDVFPMHHRIKDGITELSEC